MNLKILLCVLAMWACVPPTQAASTCSEGFYLVSHLGLCLGIFKQPHSFFSVPIWVQYLHKREHLHELL